jgi:predicted nucleic acid-binding protein
VFVLDTDALSLTNTTTGHETEAVIAWRHWVVTNQHALYLSVVTLMEVRFGIEKCHSKGATKKAAALGKWLAAAEARYRGCVLPVTAEIAHRAGTLLWSAIASGIAPSSEDALVAATADIRDFAVISRNGKHMTALNVRCFDPLGEPLPSRFGN